MILLSLRCDSPHEHWNDENRLIFEWHCVPIPLFPNTHNCCCCSPVIFSLSRLLTKWSKLYTLSPAAVSFSLSLSPKQNNVACGTFSLIPAVSFCLVINFLYFVSKYYFTIYFVILFVVNFISLAAITVLTNIKCK